jgi:hypothetical protein
VEDKKYYCSLERKITDKVIERIWQLDGPTAYEDGYMDYLKEKKGKYKAIAGAQFDSYEEAEGYYSNRYKTIFSEDEWRIVVRKIKR